MLEAPRDLVHDEAFNVGRPEDNVQVRDIAEMVPRRRARVDPVVCRWCRPRPAQLPGRLLQADGDLPGPTPALGCPGRDRPAPKAYGNDFTYDDFVSSRFVRLRRISELLSAGLVDDMLRRQTDGWLSGPTGKFAKPRTDAC